MTLAISEREVGIVSSVARQLKSRYYDFVDREDVEQELWVWLLEHGDKVSVWDEQYESPRTVERLIARSLRNAGEKFCRREKATKTGYEPEDEFFYSISMVADLLQLYFDPEYMFPGSIQYGESGSGKPPQEGGNLQAMVADVGRAYEALSEHDQWLLALVYEGPDRKDGITFLSVEWGVSYDAADKRIRRVLGRLRKNLGGPRPFEEDED